MKLPRIEKEVIVVTQITTDTCFVAKYRLWNDGTKTSMYLTPKGWKIVEEYGILGEDTSIKLVAGCVVNMAPGSDPSLD